MRKLQIRRLKVVGLVNNAEMNTKQVKKFCKLDKSSNALLKQATAQLGLTA